MSLFAELRIINGVIKPVSNTKIKLIPSIPALNLTPIDGIHENSKGNWTSAFFWNVKKATKQINNSRTEAPNAIFDKDLPLKMKKRKARRNGKKIIKAVSMY